MTTRQPLRRAFTILRAFESSNSQLGVREIAEMTGIPLASAHRTLRVLVEEGLVRFSVRSSKYELGLEAYRLGRSLGARAPWSEFVLPALRKAASESHETVCFALFDPTRLQMVTTVRAEWNNAVGIRENSGWRPLYAGAGGLAVLAFAGADVVNAILTGPQIVPETKDTIVDPKKLRSELDTIRARGYALTRGQRLVGAVAIGVPVFAQASDVVGSVYISMPEQRFVARKAKWLAELLTRCGDAIKKSLNAPSDHREQKGV